MVRLASSSAQPSNGSPKVARLHKDTKGYPLSCVRQHALILRLFSKSSIIKATNEVKTAQPPLKSPATPKPVRKPEARPISRAEWAGYTKEAIAKYGNTLRALSK